MLDFDNMSDEDLDAYLAGNSVPATQALDFDNMSDEELDAYLAGTSVQPSAPVAQTTEISQADLEPLTDTNMPGAKPDALDFSIPSSGSSEAPIVSEDSTSTIPTSFAGSSTVEDPKYMSEQEFTQASADAPRTDIGGEISTHTDPRTGATVEEVTNPGLESPLIDPIPFGKLGIFTQLPSGTLEALETAGKLSKQAHTLIKMHPELSVEKANKILKGVPVEDQVYVLANEIDTDFADFVAKAVAPSNKDRLLLKEELKKRGKVVRETIGNVEEEVATAKSNYTNMIETIAEGHTQKYGFEAMIPRLDSLIKRYDKSPSRSLSIVNNMKADLEVGQGVMDARTALQFRQDLNYLINKASRTEEKKLLNEIKGGVDKFLDANVPVETLKQVDEAITGYSKAMNNQDFMVLLDKYTKVGGTDWPRLKKALGKEKLSSPEVTQAVEIVEAFSKKYKNDARLRGAVLTKGQKEDPGGMLGVLSYAINGLRDTFIRVGTRHDELGVQKAILKSIRSGKTIDDVIRNLEANKNIPDEIKDSIFSSMNKVQKQIEYKPNAKTTGDVNIKPLTATKSGTVSDDISEGIIKENSDELSKSSIIDIYHGSSNEFNLKDYNLNKAKSGNLGKGIYVTTDEKTLIDKRKSLGNYGKKNYKTINKATSNGNFKSFDNFKDYNTDLVKAGFDASPKGKEAYNKYLKTQGFHGIQVDTIGHKNQIMLFDTSTIK